VLKLAAEITPVFRKALLPDLCIVLSSWAGVCSALAFAWSHLKASAHSTPFPLAKDRGDCERDPGSLLKHRAMHRRHLRLEFNRLWESRHQGQPPACQTFRIAEFQKERSQRLVRADEARGTDPLEAARLSDGTKIGTTNADRIIKMAITTKTLTNVMDSFPLGLSIRNRLPLPLALQSNSHASFVPTLGLLGTFIASDSIS
jgi:hypothetical protein